MHAVQNTYFLKFVGLIIWYHVLAGRLDGFTGTSIFDLAKEIVREAGISDLASAIGLFINRLNGEASTAWRASMVIHSTLVSLSRTIRLIVLTQSPWSCLVGSPHSVLTDIC